MNRISRLGEAAFGLLRFRTYLLLLVIFAIGLIFGLYQAGRSFGFILKQYRYLYMLITMLVLGFWYINATAWNDYADLDIDRVNLDNNRERPLVQGKISVFELKLIAAIAALGSLALAAIVDYRMVSLVALLLVVNLAYSLPPVAVSRRGGLAQAFLPFGYVLLPAMLGYWLVASEVSGSLLVLLASLYLIFVSRLLLKDFRDVEGDAAFGKQTFLINHGVKATAFTAIASGLVGVLLFVAYFQFWAVGIGIVFLASAGLATLHYLSRTEAWTIQKGLVSAYSRLTSGILLLMLLGFIYQVENTNLFEVYVITAGLTLLVASSVRMFITN